MNIKQHIRMTASEIAMGRYMRAPDHSAAAAAADAEFDAAFSVEALKDVVEDKGATGAGGGGDGTVAAADAGSEGAAAAAAAGGDGAGAASGDGTGAAADAGGDQGADAGAAGDQGAAAGADGATGAADDGKGGEGAAAGAGGDAGGAAGGDAGAGAAAADGGAAGKAGAGAAAVPDGSDADAILNRLAEAVASKQPKVETPPVETPAAEAPPLFNEAETAALAKFREDWPEEAKAVDLMQRELGRGVIQYVFDQIAPEVKQIKELVQTLALRAHQSDLDETIGEYPTDEEIDSIKGWVKTQPSYLQVAMNDVIEKGTAEEIGDLVGRYREATGKQPAGAQAAEPKPQGGETELSGAAKQAAEALAPVGSKRSVVQNPDDPSDFDAGWAKFKDIEV